MGRMRWIRFLTIMLYITGILAGASEPVRRIIPSIQEGFPGLPEWGIRLFLSFFVAVFAIVVVLAQAWFSRLLALVILHIERFRLAQAFNYCIAGALPQAFAANIVFLVRDGPSVTAMLSEVWIRMGFASLALVIFAVIVLVRFKPSRSRAIIYCIVMILLNAVFTLAGFSAPLT